MGSIGVTPALKKAIFDRLQETFGVRLPTMPGLDTLGCIYAAHEGRMRFGCCLGGNLYGSNPDSTFAAQAMNKLEMVVYLSTTLNTGHAWGTGRETIILPVLARDEESQPTTQESMFNYVRLSEGGRARYEGPRSEVDVIASIAEDYFNGSSSPVDWTAMRRHGRIREAIGRIVPGYEAIGRIDETKQEFHISGRTFHQPTFPTDTGRAKFHVLEVPPLVADGTDRLRLMTVRSEGQFNTVVYEDEDIYRGQDRRDVIMLNEQDMVRRGLARDDRVTVRSEVGALFNVLVRTIDIPPGNAVMYYPEANALIPRHADGQSKTPAFKSVAISIER
jgi:anaerobic selenocysteine-containing dehydrogenase